MLLLAKLGSVLFDNPLGKLAAAVVVVCGLLGSFAYQQRQIGEAKAVARQEKVDVQVKARADGAARKSADPKSRGVRDPYAATE